MSMIGIKIVNNFVSYRNFFFEFNGNIDNSPANAKYCILAQFRLVVHAVCVSYFLK